MIQHLLLLFSLTTFAASATAGDWRLWAPRDEIAPKASRESSGELVLQGDGNPAVFGGWERVFPDVRAGQWYRLQLRYLPEKLDFEPLQLPIRLDWVSAGG
jgi:hypothetical protein